MSDYYGAPQPPPYTPPVGQYASPPPNTYASPPPGAYQQQPPQQPYGAYTPDAKAPTGYYDNTYGATPSPQQPYYPQQQYAYQQPQPQQPQQQQYGYTSPPPQQPYYPPTGGDYYAGSRSASATPSAASAGYPPQQQAYAVQQHQQPTYHQPQGPGGQMDPYAYQQPSGPGAYADGSQPGYGQQPGAEGERGLGSTLIGGGAGAFIGSKMGFGKVGGAVGVCISSSC